MIPRSMREQRASHRVTTLTETTLRIRPTSVRQDMYSPHLLSVLLVLIHIYRWHRDKVIFFHAVMGLQVCSLQGNMIRYTGLHSTDP
jgi:cell shape-determining protein MreD